MTDERYVFVDADSILFTSTYGDVSKTMMRKRYLDRLNYIKVQTFATEIFVAVKGFDNFRDKLDPEYKATRKELDPKVRENLIWMHGIAKELGAVQADGWEADDQVRAWAWEAQEDDIPWVIAGIDKDLLQIPGTHFNYGGSEKKPLPEEKKWHFIDEVEGPYRMACQLLTGDTVDNIKGIKGIGPAKAKKALAGLSQKQMMTTIVELYKGEYGKDWESKLHMNCNLVYMRRWLDDEFDFREWMIG